MLNATPAILDRILRRFNEEDVVNDREAVKRLGEPVKILHLYDRANDFALEVFTTGGVGPTDLFYFRTVTNYRNGAGAYRNITMHCKGALVYDEHTMTIASHVFLRRAYLGGVYRREAFGDLWVLKTFDPFLRRLSRGALIHFEYFDRMGQFLAGEAGGENFVGLYARNWRDRLVASYSLPFLSEEQEEELPQCLREGYLRNVIFPPLEAL